MAKTRERLDTEAHKHPGVEQVDRSEIWQKAAESADTVVEEASSSSKEKPDPGRQILEICHGVIVAAVPRARHGQY